MGKLSLRDSAKLSSLRMLVRAAEVALCDEHDPENSAQRWSEKTSVPIKFDGGGYVIQHKGVRATRTSGKGAVLRAWVEKAELVISKLEAKRL